MLLNKPKFAEWDGTPIEPPGGVSNFRVHELVLGGQLLAFTKHENYLLVYVLGQVSTSYQLMVHATNLTDGSTSMGSVLASVAASTKVAAHGNEVSISMHGGGTAVTTRRRINIGTNVTISQLGNVNINANPNPNIVGNFQNSNSGVYVTTEDGNTYFGLRIGGVRAGTGIANTPFIRIYQVLDNNVLEFVLDTDIINGSATASSFDLFPVGNDLVVATGTSSGSTDQFMVFRYLDMTTRTMVDSHTQSQSNLSVQYYDSCSAFRVTEGTLFISDAFTSTKRSVVLRRHDGIYEQSATLNFFTDTAPKKRSYQVPNTNIHFVDEGGYFSIFKISSDGEPILVERFTIAQMTALGSGGAVTLAHSARFVKHRDNILALADSPTNTKRFLMWDR